MMEASPSHVREPGSAPGRGGRSRPGAGPGPRLPGRGVEGHLPSGAHDRAPAGRPSRQRALRRRPPPGGAAALRSDTVARVKSGIARDARYALRMMRRTPGFTLVSVLTLALGIGVNSAIFSLVHAVLLRPLPYAEEDRLLAVWNRWDGSPAASLSDPEFMDYDEQNQALRLAALDGGSVNLADAGDPERVDAAFVSPDLLPILGVGPVLGRGFMAEEERAGSGRVAILTHDLWARRFHGDASVVGRAVRIDGEAASIVGVLPQGFLLPSDLRSAVPAQVLLPLALDRSAPRNRRGGHYLQAVARLAPGASLEAARAEMDAVVSRLIRQYPDQHRQGHFGVTVTPLRTDLLGPARPILGVLLGAVSLVLLLACANLA